VVFANFTTKTAMLASGTEVPGIFSGVTNITTSGFSLAAKIGCTPVASLMTSHPTGLRTEYPGPLCVGDFNHDPKTRNFRNKMTRQNLRSAPIIWLLCIG